MGSSQSSDHHGRPQQYQQRPSQQFQPLQQQQQRPAPSQPARALQQSPTMRFRAIADSFNSLEQVQEELRRAGLEASQLIVAVDFTKSNEWTGKHSFGGHSLHFVGPGVMNPYEEAISAIGRTLATFDDDQLIPAYGFGDATTGDRRVFSFLPEDQPCQGLEHVLAAYRALATGAKLSGPTSFAPAIRQAMRVVAQSGGQYHILLLIADGQVTRSSDLPDHVLSAQEEETVRAIVEASNYPLSIVLVGVGDGPWDTAHKYDDWDYPGRRFDNLQFVNYTQLTQQYAANPARKEAIFALRALMEVPEQYKAIQRLGLLGRTPSQLPTTTPAPPPLPMPMQQPGHAAGMGTGVPPQQQWQQQQYGSFNSAPPQFGPSASFGGASGTPNLGSAPQYPPFAAGAPQYPSFGNAPAAHSGVYQQQQGQGLYQQPRPGMWQQQQPGQQLGAKQQPTAPSPEGELANNPMFICPITQDVMEDPVIAADGYTYDRAAITAWLRNKGTSPMTNAPMPNKELTPNHNLRSAIMEAADRQKHRR